jgi:Xaa-Pro dipeptidase
MLNISVPKAPHLQLAKRDQNAIVTKLQKEMQQNGIDTLIVFRPENIFYTTGYYPKISDIPGNVGINLSVVPSSGPASLVVTTLELEAALSLTGDDVAVTSFPSWVFIDDGTEETRKRPAAAEINAFSGLHKAVEIALGKDGTRIIGVEKSFLTVPIWEELQRLLGDFRIADSVPTFTRARMIKTPWEADMLRIAAQHNERTMYRVAQAVKPGMSCCEIDNLMNRYGYEEDKYFTADKNLFATEAAGPYFGLSGIPRGYQVKESDIVRFDGGFRHLGYVSDLARCFCVGDKPEPEAVEIYATLVESFHKGIALLRPGTVFKEIYHIMVDSVIRSKCIPFYPRGHMGHSVGLNNGLEEYPQFSATMEEVLQPGMVVCVEAPIWTNGRSEHYGAFSIEDTFLITETGCERFTHGNETLIWH